MTKGRATFNEKRFFEILKQIYVEGGYNLPEGLLPLQLELQKVDLSFNVLSCDFSLRLEYKEILKKTLMTLKNEQDTLNLLIPSDPPILLDKQEVVEHWISTKLPDIISTLCNTFPNSCQTLLLSLLASLTKGSILYFGSGCIEKFKIVQCLNQCFAIQSNHIIQRNENQLFAIKLKNDTSPEEIFGNLYFNGMNIRDTRRYLPQAKFAYIDGIEHASTNKEILSPLISILKDRTFTNADFKHSVPTLLIIGSTSNDALPFQQKNREEYLLSDSFLFRSWVQDMRQYDGDGNNLKSINRNQQATGFIPLSQPITLSLIHSTYHYAQTKVNNSKQLFFYFLSDFIAECAKHHVTLSNERRSKCKEAVFVASYTRCLMTNEEKKLSILDFSIIPFIAADSPKSLFNLMQIYLHLLHKYLSMGEFVHMKYLLGKKTPWLCDEKPYYFLSRIKDEVQKIEIQALGIALPQKNQHYNNNNEFSQQDDFICVMKTSIDNLIPIDCHKKYKLKLEISCEENIDISIGIQSFTSKKDIIYGHMFNGIDLYSVKLLKRVSVNTIQVGASRKEIFDRWVHKIDNHQLILQICHSGEFTPELIASNAVKRISPVPKMSANSWDEASHSFLITFEDPMSQDSILGGSIPGKTMISLSMKAQMHAIFDNFVSDGKKKQLCYEIYGTTKSMYDSSQKNENQKKFWLGTRFIRIITVFNCKKNKKAVFQGKVIAFEEEKGSSYLSSFHAQLLADLSLNSIIMNLPHSYCQELSIQKECLRQAKESLDGWLDDIVLHIHMNSITMGNRYHYVHSIFWNEVVSSCDNMLQTVHEEKYIHLCPLNVSHHWILVMVNMKTRVAYIFDSLATSGYHQAVSNFLQTLGRDGKTFTVENITQKKLQFDGESCGLWVCLLSELIILRNVATMSEVREMMTKELFQLSRQELDSTIYQYKELMKKRLDNLIKA